MNFKRRNMLIGFVVLCACILYGDSESRRGFLIPMLKNDKAAQALTNAIATMNAAELEVKDFISDGSKTERKFQKYLKAWSIAADTTQGTTSIAMRVYFTAEKEEKPARAVKQICRHGDESRKLLSGGYTIQFNPTNHMVKTFESDGNPAYVLHFDEDGRLTSFLAGAGERDSGVHVECAPDGSVTREEFREAR